jgi:hypothetical protein
MRISRESCRIEIVYSLSLNIARLKFDVRCLNSCLTVLACVQAVNVLKGSLDINIVVRFYPYGKSARDNALHVCSSKR